MTDQETRREFEKLELPELVELSREAGINIGGLSKADAISRMMGECTGCKNSNATVIYIPLPNSAQVMMPAKPCVGCK